MLPKGVHIEGDPSELGALLAKKPKAAWAIPIGLLTGGSIVGFQVINLFVIYRYLKLDYYLCLVAVCFLMAGWLLNNRPRKAETVAVTSRVVLAPANSPKDLLAILTSRELLVLRLLAEGKTNKEIAAAQSIGLSTVKTHVNNIYAKLSVTNRKEARSKYAELAQRFPIS